MSSFFRKQVRTGTPVQAVAATLSTNLTNATNNDLTYTAVTKGAAGNSITIRYIDPGVTTATESVAVTGSAIVITLRRSAGGVLSTAAQVKAAVDAKAEAAALVTVANKAANDGTGLVAALAATPLAGGIDGTPTPGDEIYHDTDYLYVADAPQDVSGTGWRRAALSSFS